MRKLGKKLKTASETIEAYACSCYCVCICAPADEATTAGNRYVSNYNSWENVWLFG